MKKQKTGRALKLSLTIGLLTCLYFNAQAATVKVWYGSTNSSWSNVNNWRDSNTVTTGVSAASAIPGSSDDVYISDHRGTTVDPEIHTTEAIGNFIIDDGGGSNTVTIILDSSASLTVNGNMSTAHGSEAFNTNGGTLTVTGSITGAGTLNLAGDGTVNVAGNFTITGFQAGTGGFSTVNFNGGTSQNCGGGATIKFNNLSMSNNSTIVVTASTAIEVDETLNGTSGSTLDLSGCTEADLYGDITGAFTLNPGTNYVNLQGQDPSATPRSQNIIGLTFWDLQNNNTNTTITSGNVVIGDNLDFVAGDIILNGHNLTLTTGANASGNAFYLTSGQPLSYNFGTGPIDINYDGSNGYIVTDGTSGNFIMNNGDNSAYPIGHSTSTYNPIDLHTGTATFTTRVDNSITDHNNANVTDSVVQATWQVTPDAGVTMGETVRWTTGEELSAFDRTSAALSWRTATNQWWTKLGSDAAAGAAGSDWLLTSGNNLAMTASQLYYIAMGSHNPSELPVTLTTFNARSFNGHVNLDWMTSSEINNNYFEIERSMNGQQWTAIGKVEGHGTTKTTNMYNAVDNLQGIIPQGIVYYRLKQVDYNGKFDYSMIRSVNLSNAAANVETYPVPTSDNLNIDWMANNNDNANLRIVNMAGQTVYTESLSGSGAMHRSISLASYPAGAYYVEIVTSNNITSKVIYKN